MTGRLPFMLWLVLAATLTGAPLLAQESDSVDEVISPDSQDYFLLQSFHARWAEQRKSIHHLGMLTEADEEGYRVSAVLDGYPAQQAGLRRGDLLISANGQPFHPVSSLNPQIGGNEQLTGVPLLVELTFRRNQTTQTVSLHTVYGSLFDAYRSATLASTQQFSNGNKVIGYIKLWSVDRSTNGLITFRRLIDSLAHCDGLIIDLRDSYGFLSAEHLDRFFPTRNSYFQLQGSNPDLWQHRQADRMSDDYYGRAMVVMQNEGTRGGMELFSYQLGKLQRVVTLGATTVGKAGQVIHNGDTLEYIDNVNLRVDGKPLEFNGFEPEQSVPYPLSESSSSDPQFEAAMMTLMQIM